MATICQTVPRDGVFASDVIGFLDCQARTLGSQGYAALASSGSSVSVALIALLAIFIGLIGIRLLLGEAYGARDLVLAVVKVGFVVALATAWPAYQVLIYEVALSAPAELASQVGGAAGVPGAAGGLVPRLDAADQAFRQLSVLGPGFALPDGRTPPLPIPGFDTLALGMAHGAFMTSAIGAFAFVRLAAGILLALGPLFVLFLLFDVTRPVFEGWLKALGGLVIAATATALVLGIELALLEPWLADLVARRQAQIPIPVVPGQLLAVTVAFAIVLATILRLALSLTMQAGSIRSLVKIVRETGRERLVSAFTGGTRHEETPRSEQTRASTISRSIEASVRRDEARVSEATANRISSVSQGSAASVTRDGRLGKAVPLGETYRRSARRTSASAKRRDKRA